MSQGADVSSTSLLGCKQASDRDTGRSRCAHRAAQDLRAAQVERHPLGAARQIGKMLHQRSVPMKFSMVHRFNQPPVWNFLCQQHCLLDQFVFRCNWRYSGATCGWWFSVKVLTPLYYLFPFQVGILPSNQPWVPRRCRCAKWNVIQLTDPDRTWKGISIAIPMCVCVMIKSCPRCLAISAGKRFGTSNTNLNISQHVYATVMFVQMFIQQLRRKPPSLTWCRWTKRNASFTMLNKSSHSTSTDLAGRRKQPTKLGTHFFHCLTSSGVSPSQDESLALRVIFWKEKIGGFLLGEMNGPPHLCQISEKSLQNPHPSSSSSIIHPHQGKRCWKPLPWNNWRRGEWWWRFQRSKFDVQAVRNMRSSEDRTFEIC